MCQLNAKLLLNNGQEEIIEQVSRIIVEMDSITLFRLFEEPRLLQGFHIKEIDPLRNSVYLTQLSEHSLLRNPL